MLLKEIIAEKGIDGFIQIENEVNRSLNAHKTVIATGGSVVYGKEAMEHLKKIATVVYLEIGLPALCRRLGNLKKRGVVLKEGQTLKNLYEERIPLYEKYADLTVNEHKCTIEQTVEKIVDLLEEEIGISVSQ